MAARRPGGLGLLPTCHGLPTRVLTSEPSVTLAANGSMVQGWGRAQTQS